jgi:hypothetical protein
VFEKQSIRICRGGEIRAVRRRICAIAATAVQVPRMQWKL